MQQINDAKAKQGENKNISEIVNSIMNLRAFTPNEEGLKKAEDIMIKRGLDRNIIDLVLTDIRSKRDK